MPDFKRLVRRVSETLGPGATPQQVETVSRMFLDELVARAPTTGLPPTSAQPDTKLVVSVVGHALPDIRMDVSNTAADAGYAVLSVRRDDAEHYCSFVFQLAKGADSIPLPELRSRMDALAAANGGTAGVLHADLFATLNST